MDELQLFATFVTCTDLHYDVSEKAAIEHEAKPRLDIIVRHASRVASRSRGDARNRHRRLRDHDRLRERIGVNQGEGWDGQAYAAWARDFPEAVVETGVTEFQSERVLPSALVYYALSAVGCPHTSGNVIAGFQVLDALALTVEAVLLMGISLVLGWSRTLTWVAFVATFLSFANAREALYYPTMTDPTASALAMGTVWAYVARRPVAQWGIALASAFTWPALVPFGLAALILPRTVKPLPSTTGRWHRFLALGVALSVAVFVVAWFISVLANPIQIARWLDRAHHDLYPITIASIVIPTALAAYVVARQETTWSLRAYLRDAGWRRTTVALLAAASIVGARELWHARVGIQGVGTGWRELRLYYVASAVLGPLWSLVHQVTYFGPIVIVAIGGWTRIAGTAARWGPGAVLGLTMMVFSSVSSDARHLLHMVPLLTVLAVASTASWWTPGRAVVLAGVSLAWSKLWLRIGYTTIHNSLSWPDQRFFMQHGPWATDSTFLAHLAAGIATALLLWLLLRRPAPRTE
ncbi:MAG: hypothetical protein IPQ07_44355 [Myxococcales bacterium]|nr:hypothetical protein [Myxococcales bacterium]